MAIEALGGEQTETEKSIDELVDAISSYEQVKDMAQLPGWPVFILELQKQAKFWREKCEFLLENIVLKRNSADESAFADARIQLLAFEEAIQIYLKIRENAANAKEMLKNSPPKGLESPQ